MSKRSRGRSSASASWTAKRTRLRWSLVSADRAASTFASLRRRARGGERGQPT
jgi:hypothetical protein